VAQAVADLEERVISWRRHLHANPELSFAERATVAFVREQLESLPNLELSQPTATSLVARLRGRRAGPVIGVRADWMPYRSRRTATSRSALHARE
jgi:metal-dependent amidase/aminoacylase/carboxypeptidase family protein